MVLHARALLRFKIATVQDMYARKRLAPAAWQGTGPSWHVGVQRHPARPHPLPLKTQTQPRLTSNNPAHRDTIAVGCIAMAAGSPTGPSRAAVAPPTSTANTLSENPLTPGTADCAPGLYGAPGIHAPSDLLSMAARLVLYCQELQMEMDSSETAGECLCLSRFMSRRRGQEAWAGVL
jgi:hypothetical protein